MDVPLLVLHLDYAAAILFIVRFFSQAIKKWCAGVISAPSLY